MIDEKPIIIVKKVIKKPDHHGGAWKVAYADFVTAMMAFFLVMWILGMSPDVRKVIAAYFNDPSGFMKTHSGGVSVLSVTPDSARGKPTVMPTLPGLLKRAEESAHFKQAKEALEKKIAGLPEFKDVRSFVEIRITAEGLRIELLEASASLFFETGSAKLQPRTVDLLKLIAKELGKLPNDVVIEGHTDARPYAGGITGYSNWELSSDRANAARRVMSPLLKENQVGGVRGFADRHLRNPQNPYHYSNRRISILLRYSDLPDISTADNGNAGAPSTSDLPGLGPDVNVMPGHER